MICQECSVAVLQYPKPFFQSPQSSLIASLCHTMKPWPTTFSQAWILMALWQQAIQDFMTKLTDKFFVSFFLQKF
jgi:hypothetical protein